MVGPLAPPDKGFLRPGDKRDVFVTYFELEKDYYMTIKPLYELLHAVLVEDEYMDPLSGDDKFEGLYWERILANGWKEHHIWWRCVKYPQGKTGFVRYAVKIDYQTLMVRDDEIAYKGKKTKTQRADVIIRMWFWVQWDFEDKFKNSIVKQLEQKFRRQLFKDELKQHWENLFHYSQKLRTTVKNYLDMEDTGEPPRMFHPEGGYKDPF